MILGVLALQGDVREHAAALTSLGEQVRPVYGPEDLTGLDGLILRGVSRPPSRSCSSRRVCSTRWPTSFKPAFPSSAPVPE